MTFKNVGKIKALKKKKDYLIIIIYFFNDTQMFENDHI